MHKTKPEYDHLGGGAMALPLVLGVPDTGEVRGAVVRVARHHALHPVSELRPGPLKLVIPVSPMIRPWQCELR